MAEKCGRVQGKWDLVRVTEVPLYKKDGGGARRKF